jgi:hypothetical protein
VKLLRNLSLSISFLSPVCVMTRKRKRDCTLKQRSDAWDANAEVKCARAYNFCMLYFRLAQAMAPGIPGIPAGLHIVFLLLGVSQMMIFRELSVQRR